MEILLAWTLLILAAIVGTSMVVVAMIEEAPIILRSTLGRTATRRRSEQENGRGDSEVVSRSADSRTGR